MYIIDLAHKFKKNDIIENKVIQLRRRGKISALDNCVQQPILSFASLPTACIPCMNKYNVIKIADPLIVQRIEAELLMITTTKLTIKEQFLHKSTTNIQYMNISRNVVFYPDS